MAVNINVGSSSEEEKIEKSYFDVLGLCCSSEVALVERILHSLKGVKHVSVVIPSKTVIVVHDSLLITPFQIAKALNQAKLEANVRLNSREVTHRKIWPSPYVIFCGVLLALSFFKYLYAPLQWIAVGAVAVGVWPTAIRALAAVRNFTIDVNILVLIAVMGTLALRDFLEAGTIVFLFTIAEWLQSRASHKATAVMTSLMSIAPHKATVAETGQVVNVQDVKLNTLLAVKAGEAIPIDGIVVEGSCEVDQKALTGEAFPVEKQKDSIVWAGTINLNGYICVKTTASADQCVVAKMATLVEEAQSKRPKIQRLIDTCAKYYTPAVVLVSALLAAVPAAITSSGTRLVELDKNHWFHLALVVLVSACPCGLVLSTPVATFCALSRAATTGLLIKGGDHIETLATVKVVAFDKTGTITRGDFVVTAFRSEETFCTVDDLLFWVSSLESKSSHPIADALVGYGRSHSVEPKPDLVQDFQVFPGEGISGKIDGREIYVGNRKFALRAGCASAPEIQSGGPDQDDIKTVGLVYFNGAVIGTFNLSDACRSGAADAVKQLKSMGITTALLTGDTNSAAMHAQHQLGNALDAVYAELLPEDKARIINEYKKSVGPTSMVGDGVNDAPALATADVGISMGVSGSPLATETGHVILMSNDITKIPKAIKLAKKTRRKVIENIVFSITTKVAVLAVAIAGHPIVWLAVLVDVLTCLLVIINSMLLLRHGRPSFKSHAHDHHKGNCHSHKSSSSICHDDRKKKIMGQQGSLLKLHHHHHGHDDHKNRTCTGSDDNRGCGCVKSGLVAEKTDPAKRSFQGNSTPKQHAKRGCSSHGCKSSMTCCDSVTHNDQDLCENEVDGSQGRCHLSASTPWATCQKEECRDLEGQDGCLREDDYGLMEGRSHQLICCSGHALAHAHAHVEEEEEDVNQADTKGNVVVEVGCRDGALTLPISKECQHCTGVGTVNVPSAANNSYACYIDAVGRGEIGGCCRSFRKECCQIHDHMRASLVAGFGGRASLTEITTE